MHYLFIDAKDTMVEAWKQFFGEEENVTLLAGDLTEVSCDAIVSPANSFGFMDGGVDYAISQCLETMDFPDFGEAQKYHLHINPEGWIFK